MLPAEQRLRQRRDFSEVVKHGCRASRPLLTAHVSVPPRGAVQVAGVQVSDVPLVDAPARAGLVVSKAVGGSVVRHRTARRLRHLLRSRLAALPAGALVVVRAAPAAGSATSAQLARDLDGALRRALEKAVDTPVGRARGGAVDEAGGRTVHRTGDAARTAR